MCKPAVAVAVMMAIATMAGCSAVPEWVLAGSGAYAGSHGDAIYGVGIGAPDPNPRFQRDLARMGASSAVSSAARAYVTALTKLSVERGSEQSDDEFAQALQVYAQATRQACRAVPQGAREVDTWRDVKGKHGRPGVLYMLAVVPLDAEFFDRVRSGYESVIRGLPAEEADAALQKLDTRLNTARTAPFVLTGPVTSGPGRTRR